MGERKETVIDVYKEMGFPADILSVLFIALFIFGCVILRRKLEPAWRITFLITAFLPLAAGIFLFAYGMIESVYTSSQGALGLGNRGFPLLLGETLPILRFSSWLTILLLVLSSLLFITGKDKERRTSGTPEVKREDSSDSQAI